MNKFPESFQQRITSLLKEEADAFFHSLQSLAPVSVRLHPVKFNFNSAHAWQSAEQVPWCKEGRYLSERPSFTLDPIFHSGAYYVQEASSMSIDVVFRQLFDNDREISVLDLCASPGGKSTLIASYLNGEGLLVSNEVIRSRVGALQDNITKWGYDNVIITTNDPEDFLSVGIEFDAVMVDAPCSGEGLFRKDAAAIDQWTEDSGMHCSQRQHRILESAVELIKENGYLIYSTCTYHPMENEHHIEWIKSKGFEPVRIHFYDDWNVVEETEEGFAYRFYPHRMKGEGFFLMVFKKTENSDLQKQRIKKSSLSRIKSSEWNGMINIVEGQCLLDTGKGQTIIFPENYFEELVHAMYALRVVQAGINVGEKKGKDLIPSHALALSLQTLIAIPQLNVDREDALRFLSKEVFVVPSDTPSGFVMICYNGYALGWIKNISGRVNNYLPPHLRIRMDWKK